MNEEIIHRTLQVFLYTGGFVAFWQITKHMPKAFFNILEFLIGWHDFPDPVHDTWEPVAHLSGSEHMIR